MTNTINKETGFPTILIIDPKTGDRAKNNLRVGQEIIPYVHMTVVNYALDIAIAMAQRRPSIDLSDRNTTRALVDQAHKLADRLNKLENNMTPQVYTKELLKFVDELWGPVVSVNN